MSTRSRVTIEERGRGWRLRYRVGENSRPSRTLPTYELARFAADLIERTLAARPDRDPWPMVHPLIEQYAGTLGAPAEPVKLPVDLQRSITLAEFYESWIETKEPPVCRVSQHRDYARHATYFLPVLGDAPLAKITEDQLIALRDQLLKVSGKRGRPLNVQTVRNIMSSLKRLFRDAMKPPKRVVSTFPFGEDYRGSWDLPREAARWTSKSDPFTRAEKLKLITFLRERWGKRQPHLVAYVIFQLFVPCRPSEASGLHWVDIDLANATVHFRRSFSCGAYDLTKTASSHRSAVLPPEVVAELKKIQPLRGAPEDPVFTNRDGKPIDPTNFIPTWNAALRAAGIRARGIYACKDTAVTHLRLAGGSWAFIEQQSGVSERTLRRHYHGKLPGELINEYEKLASWDAGVVAGSQPHPIQPQLKRGIKTS